MTPLYPCAIFLGAFLVFLVQPILARAILPWFGGAPAIWTTCMLFFQTVLLFGYAYAAAAIRRLSPRRNSELHLALLALTFVFLPILPNAYWKHGAAGDPTLRILGLLFATVGLPYLVLASTAPMLQAWVAADAPKGRSPYRLYALSNTGSMLALVGYPIFIEPYLTVPQQAQVWSLAYGVFVALTAVLAWKRRSAAPPATADSSDPPAPPPTLWLRSLWVSLSAVAVVLLLSVTNQMCQEVAVVPFLWVLPLTLYLLSMILCFGSEEIYSRAWFRGLLFPALAGIDWVIANTIAVGPYRGVGLLSLGLFVCCMVCHGELVRLKPHPSRLTTFYLMISLGGALGGLYVSVLAPRLIPFPFELQVGMVACLILAALAAHADPAAESRPLLRHTYLGISIAAALGIAGWLAYQSHDLFSKYQLVARNFYGVLKVKDYLRTEDSPPLRVLVNGITTHGEQILDPTRRREPTSYYAHESGVGIAIEQHKRDGPQRVGVIGLGAGTIAAFGRRGDSYTFFEINPLVERVSRSEFHFLNDCEAEVKVVLGDARISLESAETPFGFDILAVDAFSSDSIPVHLLTREAVELYFRHLAPDGILAVHISNRNLNLEPVVQSIAKALSKEAMRVGNSEDDTRAVMSSDWILVTADAEFFHAPHVQDSVKELEAPEEGFRLWTDDFSNLFKILKPNK